jgi:hypothetical protein
VAGRSRAPKSHQGPLRRRRHRDPAPPADGVGPLGVGGPPTTGRCGAMTRPGPGTGPLAVCSSESSNRSGNRFPSHRGTRP